LIDIILKEEDKLYYLKFYGMLEKSELNLDLLKFELIFNRISYQMKKGKYIYTHKLDSLYKSLDEDQRKGVLMQLLKLLIK
jgi:hypothetical protein